MASGNYTIFKANQVDVFQFGDTAWTEADMASTANALDTTFATNNATPLLDLVGELDGNDPVTSAPFAMEVKITGNERSIEEEDLLGNDVSGAQNKEVVGGSVSKLRCEANLMYRNNVPLSIFNDSTKCALITMDNGESASTGKLNIAMNNITIVQVGGIERTPNGSMKQKIVFDFKGGIVGSPISVTQASPSETWSKVRGGDYAEEVQVA